MSLSELLNPIKVMREDLLDLDTYWLCHDRIDHPSHDMMIHLQRLHMDILSLERLVRFTKPVP